MTAKTLFENLHVKEPDPLLSLIALYRDDPREAKLDLGVGVYRDADGNTPVLQAVKTAEAILLETQTSKSYLGAEGNLDFLRLLQPRIFGPGDATVFGVQTPGGTGALRLAAELGNVANPSGRIWVGTPTWPNHHPIFDVAGLKTAAFAYFDVATQRLLFDEMTENLKAAKAGDMILLHGCCHNPSGADPTPEQWKTLAAFISNRGVVPLIDLAYQGLGQGFEKDAAGTRLVLEACEDVLIAYSCDKNFGLYRERTGALYAKSRSKNRAALMRSNILALSRANWSMPPDHGAAVVAEILGSNTLQQTWQEELETMCRRIAAMRNAAADADQSLTALRDQKGIFSLLDLSPAQIARLRDEFAIYMPASGRVNVAGLSPHSIPKFVAALRACLS